MTPHQIRQHLRADRKAAGYSQLQFAKMVGISHAQYKRLENGTCDMNLETATRVFLFLGKELDLIPKQP